MKRKYDLRFLLTYLRLESSKILKKINLNETNISKILISLCLIFCCSIFVYTYSTNWYADSNNLNGLLTEVQGMIIEVFFFAIIINWITILRENRKQKPLKSYYYYVISTEIENFLGVTFPEIREERKKYIYFLDNSVITYDFSILPSYKYFEIEDKEIFEILYENKEYEYFYEHYLKPKEILIKRLRKILSKNTSLFEHDIRYKFLNLENYNETLKDKENKITKDNCNHDIIMKFIKSGLYRVFIFLLLEVRNRINNNSDQVLSSAEEQKKRELEMERLTEELAQLNSK